MTPRDEFHEASDVSGHTGVRRPRLRRYHIKQSVSGQLVTHRDT